MPTLSLTKMNPSKAVSCAAFIAFAVLMGVWADGFGPQYGMWAVFSPMFTLDVIVFTAAVSGYVMYRRTDPYDRMEGDEQDVREMCTSASLFIFKLAFEIMTCLNVDQAAGIHWMLVFLPLYGMSLIAAVVAVRQKLRRRNVDMEVLFAAGFLPFLFVALRLSNSIDWGWQLVFIPIWLLLCLLTLLWAYYVIFLVISVLSAESTLDERVGYAAKTFGATLILCPATAFFILLAMRLNGDINTYFTVIAIPFILSVGFLMWTAFIQSGGNPWWFGYRLYTTEVERLLPTVGQISYTPIRVSALDDDNENGGNGGGATHSDGTEPQSNAEPASLEKDKLWRPPPPYVSILMPD